MRQLEIVAVPSVAVRQSIPFEAWNESLQTWTAIIAAHLLSNDNDFSSVCKNPSIVRFLSSFYRERATSPPEDGTLRSQAANVLARQCFQFLIRAQNLHLLQLLFQDLAFLEALAKCHVRSKGLKALLTQASAAYSKELNQHLHEWQTSVIAQLASSSPGAASSSLNSIAPVFHSGPDLAKMLLTGSDFLEAAQLSYSKSTNNKLRHSMVLVMYLSLVGLISSSQPNPAQLADTLYSLKAQSRETETSMLADIITNTPLLKRTQQYSRATSHERLLKLADELKAFQSPSMKHANASGPRNKGKHRAAIDADVHIHRMSLVTQIQDLFPDLGAGFVLRLLDAYADNVEEVTARLLEDTLPAELRNADKHELAPVFSSDRAGVVDHLIPRSTPPPPAEELYIPQRHNAYDDDELDRLNFDTNRLHIGKKETSTDSTAPNKAAILAALAAFDSDDDERDDTYDVEDVGGTVDSAHVDGDETVASSFDETDLKLYKHYEASPEAFGRSADVRRSAGRASLRKETGMTDEVIEGWAIMLQREPRRARKLAFEASRFDGRQKEVASTAYREGRDTETEDSDTQTRSTRPSVRGRGRGRGGATHGTHAAGAPSEPSTAAAKRRKEANKSSRANHNRRNQRAKKMARGGFAGVA